MNRAGWAAAAWCAGLTACAAGQEAKQPYAQPLGDGAVRFFESEEAFKAAPPSFVLEGKSPEQVGKPQRLRTIPEFSTTEFPPGHPLKTVTVRLEQGLSLYGLGAVPGPLVRNGREPSGLGWLSCPWIMGVRSDGTAFGILVDTAYSCCVLERELNFRDSIVFATEAPSPGLVVFEGQSPRDVLVALNETTGRVEMPPRWALGLGAEIGGDALTGIERLRKVQVPLDGAVLRQQLKAGSKRDAGATALLSGLAREHVHPSATLASEMSLRPGDALYESAKAANPWIRMADGTPMGASFIVDWAMPDYTRNETRKWLGNIVRELVNTGVDGLLIGGIREGLPPEGQCDADADLGGPGTVSQYIARLPALWSRAARDGFDCERTGKRPLVCGFSDTPTIQRWAMTQLVDHRIQRQMLSQALLREALSLSLSGQALCNWHISFSDEADVSRAIGIGSLMPAVSVDLVGASQTIGEPYYQQLKTALSRRSRLIPYYYTLCFYAFRDCEPILRPLFFADPKNLTLRDRDDAFLVGPDLLVVPRLDKDKPKPACPLKGGWRKIDWGDGEQPDLPDVYLRPGAILPLGPVMQWTSEKPLDPLTLLINLDSAGAAAGSLYEDDGDGYAFEHNQCRRSGYQAELKDNAVFVRLSGLDGGWPIPRRKLEVRILTDAGEVTGTGSERGTVKIDLPAPKAP